MNITQQAAKHIYIHTYTHICMCTSKEEIKNQNIMNTFEMEMELVTHRLKVISKDV